MKSTRLLPGVGRGEAIAASEADSWIDDEVVGCEFPDVRHGKRLRQLLEQLVQLRHGHARTGQV